MQRSGGPLRSQVHKAIVRCHNIFLAGVSIACRGSLMACKAHLQATGEGILGIQEQTFDDNIGRVLVFHTYHCNPDNIDGRVILVWRMS